jgi:hypothetical protein
MCFRAIAPDQGPQRSKKTCLPGIRRLIPPLASSAPEAFCVFHAFTNKVIVAIAGFRKAGHPNLVQSLGLLNLQQDFSKVANHIGIEVPSSDPGFGDIPKPGNYTQLVFILLVRVVLYGTSIKLASDHCLGYGVVAPQVLESAQIISMNPRICQFGLRKMAPYRRVGVPERNATAFQVTKVINIAILAYHEHSFEGLSASHQLHGN